MAKIKDVVNVSITKSTSNVSQVGFGTALLLTETTAILDRVKKYSSVAELLADKTFGTSNPVYKAAQALMGQKIQPAAFKVARKGSITNNASYLLMCAPTGTGSFRLSVNGKTTTNLTKASTAAEITAALTALDSVGSGNVTTASVTDVAVAKTITFKGALASTPVDLQVVNVDASYDAYVLFGDMVVFSATAEDGYFTLTLNNETTEPISYNDDEIIVQTALENLAKVDVGDVTVSYIGTARSFLVIYANNLYGVHNTLTADTSALKDGSSNVLSSTITSCAQGQDKESYTTAINAAVAYDNDWYSLITVDLSTADDRADQKEVAELIETLPTKLYAIRTVDSAVVNNKYSSTSPTDIAADLKALSIDKSFVVYHSVSNSEEFPEAAIIGLQLSKTPGSSTFKFKTLKLILAEALSTTQESDIYDKSANFNATIAGVNVFLNGTVASGEFIDVMVGIDYLTVRMQETIFGALTSSEKIPFTTSGLNIISALVRTALKLYGADADIIDFKTVVITMPEIADIPVSDLNNRILNNVKFSAKLTGAIHKLKISGEVYA